MEEAEIKPDDWVYVFDQFRGRVVRIRHIFDVTYYDVEVGGVIIPYVRDEITLIEKE